MKKINDYKTFIAENTSSAKLAKLNHADKTDFVSEEDLELQELCLTPRPENDNEPIVETHKEEGEKFNHLKTFEQFALR